MHCRSIGFCLLLFLLVAGQNDAHGEINSVHPRACQPGQTTRLTLRGKDLDDSLRIMASSPNVGLHVESIAATEATIDLTLPSELPLGPLALWIADANGPLTPQVVIVDDLKAELDNGKNHSLETAQPIPTLGAVAGICEGSQSDFYRITVSEGQRVAFAIHTQPLLSAMDPVVRLIDAMGNTMHLADDDAIGPDCRFAHQFSAAGDYWLQVHDNRHAAGGAYHLRVGDFPILSHCYPLAIRRGENAKIEFAGPDGSLMESREVAIPAAFTGRSLSVAARLQEGKSSAWVSVLASDQVQFCESADTPSQEPLTFPIGISGRLQDSQSRDSYSIHGVKDQTVRFASRTRSVGCPTLLEMQLFNAADAKVAETKVSEADQWSFDYTFPDDGTYRLEVSDLLKRGGDDFGYWIEIVPSGAFSIALKADAKAHDQFALEVEKGAFALDLEIERFGYDGVIELSLSDEIPGLRIANPRIPATAKAARVFFFADENWTVGSLHAIRLQGTALDHPEIASTLGSHALRRLKEPFILTPASWRDGAVMIAGVAKTDSPFALQPAAPIQFARPLKQHVAALTLKRIEKEFKEGVSFLREGLPVGWSVSAKADKDAYTTTFVQTAASRGEPDQIPVRVFAEFKGRGRIETFTLPVQWIDPLQIQLEVPDALVAGSQSTIRAKIVREGNDPQPIVFKLGELPPGVTGPESITATAEQTQIEFELSVSPDAEPVADGTLNLEASSTYGGSDFKVASNSIPIDVVESPKALQIYPSEIVLAGSRSQQQMIITGYDSEQSARDWTNDVRITSSNAAIAEVIGSVVIPRSDGEAEIIVEAGVLRETVPVRVTSSTSSSAIAFESEVLVALSKQGCNSGACHGSPSGKGGFRLSLRAFDKQLDELTLIREHFARRVNVLQPDQSLLLLKPSMKVPHGGGKQLHQTDVAYQVLHDWIAEGAKSDPEDAARCIRLEVFPQQKRVLAVKHGGQQLAVTAHFSDGSQRDVTQLVAYSSSDTNVATIDKHGGVTPFKQGETVILVRYLEHIESLPLMFVENSESFQWKSFPPNNYVDELVNAKLQQLQYLPSETCTDSEFIRRIFLDVIGILPTVEETKTFLADTSGDKRTRLIDSLLERDEYAKFWALKWGDLLKLTSKMVGDEGVYKYHRWVEESLRENMPYDEFARQLLTGSGSTLANPPANFYRTSTDMNECVETISQVFLGARLQCAKCHNHPFERWTQDNYYGLGAFFHRVQRRKTQRPGEMFIYSSFSGEVTQPRTGQVIQPWLPRVGSIETKNDQDRRLEFAQWLVDADNPYFAKIEANRIWSHLFSRGIVDPIDDFRDSNPPSNEPLLDALAKDFSDHGFDRKHLLRTILASRAYQASYRTNEFNRHDEMYFSHQEPRLFSAEQLLDAINQSLGLKQKFGNLPAGTMATQLPAPDIVKVDFLKVFGQPERSSVCACERTSDSNLGMAIELFNGPMMHEKLRDANNRFRTALAAGQSIEETIDELYLSAVCREPSKEERTAALEHCASRDDVASGLEDVCWALFNTDEFLFQH